MKYKVFALSSALFGLLTGASCLAASNDALLNLLVRKGVLTETEAAEVAAELKAEKAPTVAFKAKEDETVKLQFSGRLHYQYDSIGMEENGVDLPRANHFYFRRLRLGVKATHESGVFAETVVDFAENDLSIDKALAGYQFADWLTGSAGYQKVPFGFQESISSSKIKTIERSAANRFLVDDIDFAGRHSGLHAEGDLGAGFSYAGALVNAAQGEGSRLLGASNADNDLAVFGRLQWTGNGFTIGADGGVQSNNTVVGDDVTAFTGYANYKTGGFDALGEYFWGDMGAAEEVNGCAIRLAYRHGRFEPVVRYTWVKSELFEIDTDELIRRAPSGGTVTGGNNELSAYYFGLNYYHNKSVSLMLGYEFGEADSDTNDEVKVEGGRARLQVLW
jgi:phosphate-selective porin